MFQRKIKHKCFAILKENITFVITRCTESVLEKPFWDQALSLDLPLFILVFHLMLSCFNQEGEALKAIKGRYHWKDERDKTLPFHRCREKNLMRLNAEKDDNEKLLSMAKKTTHEWKCRKRWPTIEEERVPTFKVSIAHVWWGKANLHLHLDYLDFH